MEQDLLTRYPTGIPVDVKNEVKVTNPVDKTKIPIPLRITGKVEVSAPAFFKVGETYQIEYQVYPAGGLTGFTCKVNAIDSGWLDVSLVNGPAGNRWINTAWISFVYK